MVIYASVLKQDKMRSHKLINTSWKKPDKFILLDPAYVGALCAGLLFLKFSVKFIKAIRPK